MAAEQWQSRLARRFARSGSFWRSDSGNVAIIFAFALIPLLVAVGGAIDLSRALLAKQRLVSALDATALSLGADRTSSERQLRERARSFFEANYTDTLIGTPGPIVITIGEQEVSISGTAQLDTTLLRLSEIDQINVSAVSEITRKAGNLRISR